MFTVWEDGAVVGSVGFWEGSWLGEDVYETGWMTLPQYAGRGLATKAALEIIALARKAGKRQISPRVSERPQRRIQRGVPQCRVHESGRAYGRVSERPLDAL